MACRNYQIQPLTGSEGDRYKLFGLVYIITGLSVTGLNIAFIVIYKGSMYGNNLPIGTGVYASIVGFIAIAGGVTKKTVLVRSVMMMNFGVFGLSLGAIGISAGHLAPNIEKVSTEGLGILSGMIGIGILDILLALYVGITTYSLLKTKQRIDEGPVTIQNMQVPQGFNNFAPPPPGYNGFAPSGNISTVHAAPAPPGYPGYQPSPNHPPPNYSSQTDFGMGTKN